MSYPFSLEDVRFLRSAPGEAALAVAAELTLTESTLLTDLTRLRRECADRAGPVAETVRLRRKAAARWGAGYQEWLLTGEALQQAAPPLVAAHRARRLSGNGVHDLTCSIGADLAAFGAACSVAIGSDLDPVRLAMARHNLVVAGVPVRLAMADARAVTSRGLVRYADPARRDAAGRRITSADTVPSVAELDAADPGDLPVLRLPPGIDYPALARPGEIEIVSLDGSVREAVSWPAPLAQVPRRATVLRSAGVGYQLTSRDPDDVEITPIGQWLIDPDPAVIRAHLVRHYAARHGLTQIDPHLAYLTGPQPPTGMRAFRVLDAAPYRERTIAGWARRDRIGTLEILQRGTPLIPDELRRRLRSALTGSTSVARTLVLARVGRAVEAFWCTAVAGE